MKKYTAITEHDYLRAHRKASREEEIMLHGRPLPHSKPHKSKKAYDRKNQKAALKRLPFEFYLIHFEAGLTVGFREAFSHIATTALRR